MIEIQEYSPIYQDQVIALCNEFQDYLVPLDPEKLLQRAPGYGAWSLKRKLEKSSKYKCRFSIAIEDSKVLGFVFACIDPTPPPEVVYSTKITKTGSIEELYVVDRVRGSGVGTQLTQHIETYLENEGCEYIGLGVLAFNEPAQRFYSELGYTLRGLHYSKKVKII